MPAASASPRTASSNSPPLAIRMSSSRSSAKKSCAPTRCGATSLPSPRPAPTPRPAACLARTAWTIKRAAPASGCLTAPSTRSRTAFASTTTCRLTRTAIRSRRSRPPSATFTKLSCARPQATSSHVSRPKAS